MTVEARAQLLNADLHMTPRALRSAEPYQYFANNFVEGRGSVGADQQAEGKPLPDRTADYRRFTQHFQRLRMRFQLRTSWLLRPENS